MKMSNHKKETQVDYLNSHTLLFAKKLCETIGDMTGVQFSIKNDTFEEKSFQYNNGMIVYIQFYGKVQGDFIIGIKERSALQLTGLGDPNTTTNEEMIGMREDIYGFFNEVINIAAAQTLAELERIFENLTYFPAIVVFGDIIFPEVRSAFVEVESGSSSIKCGFSLNMVSAKIAKKLEKVEKSLENTTKLASTDALTKMYNRTFFESVFNTYIHETRKNESNLSILLIDIDYFKQFNDTYGHLVGDQVIKHVAECIRLMSRSSDIAVRFGGDEMLVVLPGTDLEKATQIAERILCKIRENKEVTGIDGKEIFVQVTVSIGCTVLNGIDEPVSFFERADSNLYKAKEQGRNRIVAEK
jgi:diguanylate cyclase (GGDEF)-like protein